MDASTRKQYETCEVKIRGSTESGMELDTAIPVRWESHAAVRVAPKSIVISDDRSLTQYSAEIAVESTKDFEVVDAISDSSLVECSFTHGRAQTHSVAVRINLSAKQSRFVSSLTIVTDEGTHTRVPIIVLKRGSIPTGD